MQQRTNGAYSRPGNDDDLHAVLTAWIASVQDGRQSVLTRLRNVESITEMGSLYSEFDIWLVSIKKQLIHHLATHRLCHVGITEELHNLVYNLAGVSAAADVNIEKHKSSLERMLSNISTQRYLLTRNIQDRAALRKILDILRKDSSNHIPFDSFDFNEFAGLMRWTHKLSEHWEEIRDLELYARDSIMMRITLGMLRLVTWTAKYKVELIALIHARIDALNQEKDEGEKTFQEYKLQAAAKKKQHGAAIQAAETINHARELISGLNAFALLIKSARDVCRSVVEIDAYFTNLTLEGYVNNRDHLEKKQKQLHACELKVREICAFPELGGSSFDVKLHQFISQVVRRSQFALERLRVVHEKSNDVATLLQKTSRLVNSPRFSLFEDSAQYAQRLAEMELDINDNIAALKKMASAEFAAASILELIDKLEKQKQELLAAAKSNGELVERQREMLADLEKAREEQLKRTERSAALSLFKLLEFQIYNCINMRELIAVFKKHRELLGVDIMSFEIFSSIFKKIAKLYQKKLYEKNVDDIGEILGAFENSVNAYEPVEGGAIALHFSLINILGSINIIHIDTQPELQHKLSKLLNFNMAFHAAGNQVYTHFFICAKAGVDIKYAVRDFINSHDDLLSSNRGDLAMLIFSCYMHDANCGSKESMIDENTIKLIFAKINQAHVETASDLLSNQSLFSRRGSNDMRAQWEVDNARCLLLAEAFYQCKLPAGLRASLSGLLSSQRKNKISASQKLLFDKLHDELKSCPDVEILLEGEMRGCLNADIRILSKKKDKIFDVEFDGLKFHYYKQTNFEPVRPLKLIREHNARDVLLQKNHIEVHRFTDLKSSSEKFRQLISQIKSEAALTAGTTL